MKKPFPKIRLLIITVLFVNWIAFAIATLSYDRVQFIPVLIILTASVLLVFINKWTDSVSLVLFGIKIGGTIYSFVIYCNERELIETGLCYETAFRVLRNLGWVNNSFDVISIVTVVYLAVVLSKGLFKKKELGLS